MLSRKWILAGLLVVTLLAAGVGSGLALAQGPTPSTPPKTWLELYWQTLAQKLGTTVEKLQQAMQDARKEAAAEEGATRLVMVLAHGWSFQAFAPQRAASRRSMRRPAQNTAMPRATRKRPTRYSIAVA